MAKKHPAEEISSPESQQPKRARPDALTFKNRKGNIQSTHTWPTTDDVVVLRTAARTDSETPESVFFASRTILRRDSAVFATMFTLPQPIEEQKGGVSKSTSSDSSYDGHPLVEVSDSPADLQDFLEALHDYCSYTVNPEAKSVLSITALLRMSAKYQAVRIQQRMINKLLKQYPANLEDLQNIIASIDLDSPGNHLLTLNALVEVNYPVMLPAVAYQCAMSFFFADIIDAPIRNSPTTDIDEDETPWFATEESKGWGLKVHNATGRMYFDIVRDVLRARDVKCESRKACNRVYESWYDKFSTEALVEHPMDPFWRSLYRYRKAGLCRPCSVVADAVLKKRLDKLWNSLPGFISLANWKVLEKQSIIAQAETSGDSAGGGDSTGAAADVL